MRCCLATDLGYTLEYINAMEWPDVIAFLKHWQHQPPLRRLVQAALGKFGMTYSPPQEPERTQSPDGRAPVDAAPGTSYDNLPLSVQDWLRKVKTGAVQ